MVKVIVFDFDGTIANSIPLSITILKKLALNDFKKKIDDNLVKELRDKPIPEIFKALGISIVKLPIIAMKARREFNKEIAKLKPFKDMNSLLLDMHSQGYRLGIVSSNSIESIEIFLKENQLEIFDFIYSNSKVFGKSSSLKKVMKEYKCTEKEIIYLGDEIRDIQAAHEIGIKNISVTWGVNSEEKLTGYDPDFIARSPQDIMKIIKKIHADDKQIFPAE